MASPDENFMFISDEERAEVRAALLASVVDEARIAVRAARDDPSEESWYRLVDALGRLIGPDDTYALLRLVAQRSVR